MLLTRLLLAHVALSSALWSGAAAPAPDRSTDPSAELPIVAQARVSAVLGRDIPEYRAVATEHGVQMGNPRHGIAASFTRDGLVVEAAGDSWGMSLRGYGYGDEVRAVTPTAASADANRAEYRRGPLTEWYVNGPLGLEQGFTLEHPPGQANGRPLTFILELSGNLTAKANPSNDGAVLHRDGRVAALRYSGLVAFDAAGRNLPARMEFAQGQMSLRVDDSNAQYPVTVDPLFQQAKLVASDANQLHRVGWALAASGDTVVAGAPRWSGPSSEVPSVRLGAVYVFVRPPAGWGSGLLTETARLMSSDPHEHAELGDAVAIDGDTIVASTRCNAFPGVERCPGAVYVWVKPLAGWGGVRTADAKLVKPDGYEDHFLASVAVSGDTIVAGAPTTTLGANTPRPAWIWTRPITGWSGQLSPAAELIGGGVGNGFGISAAASGNTLVIGSQSQSQDAAHVFVRPPGGWSGVLTEAATLLPSSGTTTGSFADAIAVQGDLVAVGAVFQGGGATYVFLRPPGGWAGIVNEAAKLVPSDLPTDTRIGRRVAVDGDIIVAASIAGVPGEAAYVFEKPPGGWSGVVNETARLVASLPQPPNSYGRGVAISNGVVFVSSSLDQSLAPAQGSVYLYENSTETDLSVSQTVSPGPAVGVLLTNTVAVTNNGPLPATGVTLINRLPAIVTFGSATPSQGTCAQDGFLIVCSLGTLAPGADAEVQVFVTPFSGGTFSNVAEASSKESDPDPSNNTITGTANIAGPILNFVEKPEEPASGTMPVTLIFSEVTAPGATFLTASASGPAPPEGFLQGSPPIYYNLSTTAMFNGPVQLCISYSGVSYFGEERIRLFQYQGIQWSDVTLSLDLTNHVICGAVNSLSTFAIFFPSPTQTGTGYTITNLGTLGGSESTARGINNHGHVVGTATDSEEMLHAFRTAPNGLIYPGISDLGTLGGTFSQAFGINDAGKAVGMSYLAGDSAIRGFTAAPGASATNNLGTLAGLGTEAYAINASGQVVGSSGFGSGNRAFRTAPNSPINPATDNLGTLGGVSSQALAINAAGQVTGDSYFGGGGCCRAFRTAPNSPINPATDDLGTLGGSSSVGIGINDLGQVVGFAYIAGNSTAHAFRTAPNSPINPATDDLGTIAGAWSEALDINNLGQVVGYSDADDPEGNSHAFLYTEGVMHDLNDFLPPNSGWLLIQATAINDVGQIVGGGLLDGAFRAFRMDPISTDVVVEPVDTTTGTTPVTLTFSSAAAGGTTTLTTSSAGPPPPSGFQLGDPPTYYEITTTALFNGNIQVCIDYSGVSYPNESELGLFHFEGSEWVDRTVSLDTANDVICAIVTSLSPFAIFAPEPVSATTTLESIADTYLKSGSPNQNQSGETLLRIQDSGNNRALVRFDPAAIAAAVGGAGVASARLRLYLAGNGNNWGSSGQMVGAHRVTQSWTETGATWNCPDDINTANSSPNCSPAWNMNDYPSWPFVSTPSGLALHTNGKTGWVEWDVTQDVVAFVSGAAGNFGWIVRKMDEGQNGQVEYAARETANGPQLVITTGTPQPPPGPSLKAARDAYVRSGQPNQNQGYDTSLRIQDSGNNRALVYVDQAAIAAFVGSQTLQSARLRLYITDNGNNWGTQGRAVGIHRMTAAWTEHGATWNCPDDVNPVNSKKDCSPEWSMSQSAQWPFAATASAVQTIVNNQAEWVEWDVTADVAAFVAGTTANFGWIVKKDQEGQPGRVEFSSREGGFEPELVLLLQP